MSPCCAVKGLAWQTMHRISSERDRKASQQDADMDGNAAKGLELLGNLAFDNRILAGSIALDRVKELTISRELCFNWQIMS